MREDVKPKASEHRHRGKFTENMLDPQRVLQALDLKPGQTVLDAGCGNGYMTKRFAGKVSPGGKVYALDTDVSFLDALALDTRGSNIEIVQGDITRPTGLEPSCLDLLYLSAVFHGFSKKQRQGFVNEAKRLLKPHGVLAIVEIEKTETPFGPPLELRFAPDELKAVIPMTPEHTAQVGEHFYLQRFRE